MKRSRTLEEASERITELLMTNEASIERVANYRLQLRTLIRAPLGDADYVKRKESFDNINAAT